LKYQTNPQLGPFLNHWGCHICSILCKVEIRGGVKFTNAEVYAIYQEAIHAGIVQAEIKNELGQPLDGCTVYDGARLFNLAAGFKGVPDRAASYRHENADYVIKSNEEEILELKRSGYLGSHFVSGTGISNPDHWQGEIEFDPIEGGSQCGRIGYIASKRILKFE
jgi:hypothetical protein